jgi:VIT1/CCC1 family predicted Fe2+/Mn2+ transporter
MRFIPALIVTPVVLALALGVYTGNVPGGETMSPTFRLWGALALVLVAIVGGVRASR